MGAIEISRIIIILVIVVVVVVAFVVVIIITRARARTHARTHTKYTDTRTSIDQEVVFSAQSTAANATLAVCDIGRVTGIA